MRPCVVTWKKNVAVIVARGAKLCKKYQMKSNDYTVCRTYFVHQSYGDFRKVISVVHGMLYTCNYFVHAEVKIRIFDLFYMCMELESVSFLVHN